MENDACKEIVKWILNLKDLDINVYRTLLKLGGAKVSLITDVIGRDRSTIQRSLNRLVDAGLCYKEKKLLRNGGYYYVYFAKKPEEVKSVVEECLDRWYRTIKEKLLSGEILR